MLTQLLKFDLLQRCFVVWVCGLIFKEKKNRFFIWLPVSLCIYAAIFAVDYYLVTGAYNVSMLSGEITLYDELLLSLAKAFFCCVCLCLTYYLCCEVTFNQAVFTGLALFTVEKIGYNVFLLRDTACFINETVSDPQFVWLEFVVLPACYIIIYFQFLDEMEKPGTVYANKSLMFIIALILETSIAAFVKCSSLASSPFMVSLHCINEIVVYVGIFWIQSLYEAKEKYKLLATTELKLRQDQQQQYEIFEKNTDQLNHKFHDFKHVVSALRTEDNRQKKMLFIQDVEQNMAIYNSRIKTGNSALDTILTETILTCDRQKIEWTCMADGTALEFMNAVDLCRLMGNALDNAVESVMKIDDPEKRFLAVNIRRRDGLAFIRISNYCGEIPDFVNGLPLSTKLNKTEHGYGMQSIHNIAELYDGEYKIDIKNGIFTLNIMFPIPQKNKGLT